MLKRLLASFILYAMAVTAIGQTVYENRTDGKIWIRILPEYRVVSSLESDYNNLDINHLPFLKNLRDTYGIQSLRKPFWQAFGHADLQRTYEIQFSQWADVDALLEALNKTPGVDFAEAVPLLKTCLVPNDPSLGSQWHLATIDAANAWNYFSTGSTVVIAIVDDAVERSHSDLSQNIWTNPGEISGNGIDDDGNGYIDDINGYDVASNDNNPNPPNSNYNHGTHVAGIASARSGNNTGVASIGFSCKLMCVKASNNPGSIAYGYDGIIYAANSGADIINMSWGGSFFSVTGQSVIDYAAAQGCVLIAASGNNNTNTLFYPAAYNNVVSVAATSSNDTKAGFSNYGNWIDISAPGNNIYSTTVGNSYGNLSGTSMASPLVAGLAGLMKSFNPGITPAQLTACLTGSADNIDLVNPGYIGQLGAGRINANTAMTCVSGLLALPPVADFTGSPLIINAGASAAFTDMSINNPTSWSWTFTGGNPASFNGQNPPPVSYANPGTYAVSLTTTNANGSDTKTVNAYITVIGALGCDSLNLPLPNNWTLSNYFTGVSVGADGWINGMNVYLDKQKAMYFDASLLPYTQMSSALIAFGLAYSANPAKIVPVRVYDGTSGTPGAQIGAVNLTMGQIMNDVNGSLYTVADFSSPITLPVSKRFFLAVDLTNLAWSVSTKDTLSIVSNSNGQTVPSAIWEQQSNNTWYQYTTPGSWNLSASLIMHPVLTTQPVVAQFTQSATTICPGNSISFDNAGSTFQDTLLWVFPGGTPNISNSPTPTVFYNTPGTYPVVMYVIGGACSELDSAMSTVTVTAAPALNVSANPLVICSGQSSTLTVSGASSYAWSPAGSLNMATGPSVIATPSATTHYTVVGTQNGCTASADIEVQVLPSPVLTATISTAMPDCNDPVMMDATGSSDVTNFAWTFTGGTPATGQASFEQVTYAANGTFPVTLIGTSICGSDTASFTITVTNCGLETGEINPDDVRIWQNHDNLIVQMDATEAFQITDMLGRVVYLSGSYEDSQTIFTIPVNHWQAGVYALITSKGSSQKILINR